MGKNRILVVDDDSNITREVKKALEDINFDVDTADNGKTALKLWQKNIYDLVIADLRIPEIDGRELIDKIKTQQPRTQVIILSGLGREEDMIAGINKHVFRYLSKPVNRDDLLKAVEDALLERDPVIISLEQLAIKNPDEPILLVGKKSYTPKQLFDEVRKETPTGKKFHDEFLKSLTDFEPLNESVDELLGIK